MKYDEVIEIIKKQAGIMPRNVELARVLNLSQQAMGMRIKQNTNFSDNDLELLSEEYNVNFHEQDSVFIDHIHINPSCGKGTAVYDTADVTPVKLGTELIRSVLRVSNPNVLKIFQASGDSMEPIIEDGDLLLVDTSRIDFHNGGIFLITINNDWYIKRLRKRMNGQLEVISDNTKYDKEIFNPNDNVEIYIKGRVLKNLSRGL